VAISAGRANLTCYFCVEKKYLDLMINELDTDTEHNLANGLVVSEGKWGAPGLGFESQLLQGTFYPVGARSPGEWEVGDVALDSRVT
jgi:hypothetical protein